jgi:2-methylcitrate dehydratase PrpD
LRNSFKPYPCGIVIHPTIDGCSKLHNQITELGLNSQNIRAIKIKVHPLVLELTGKRFPKDGLEGKFSVFHGAAIGLLFGKGAPSEYEDPVVQDAKVIAIRDKADAEADDSLRADEAIICVTMDDGRVLAKHIKHAVGSLEVPMSDAMLERKFEDQCIAVLGADQTKAVSGACWKIESVSDVAHISQIL